MPKLHDQHEKMKDMNQIHFAVLDHNDRYYSAEEIMRYIDIRVIHVNFTYTNGKKRKKTYSSVKDCTENDFKGND